MAKYGFELKQICVNAYHNNEGSYAHIAKKYGIKDKKQIINWVHSYGKLGADSLIRSRQSKHYSFEYKFHVVELYLSSEVSYRDLALAEGINNPALITKWVNDFRISGPDALRPKKKGRKKTLNMSDKKKAIQSVAISPIDTSAEHVKELENEFLKLRIENTYLKELRRLRLEEETLLKKQRESSSASEENSN